MLDLSSKGTVPVLQLKDQVIDESVDVMAWALSRTELSQTEPVRADADSWEPVPFPHPLVTANDAEFKHYLDRYKYFERFPEHSQAYYLEKCMLFLNDLEARLAKTKFLLGEKLTWVDVAIFPFIRQFAFVDKDVFDDLPLPMLQNWLVEHLQSDLFKRVMNKYPVWVDGQGYLVTNFSEQLNDATQRSG